jgi:hypothetical protein
MSSPIAAAVLASRGGPRLQAALASVAWASERVVIDPAGRLTGETLPAGVRRAGEPADATSAPWLLLLEEHEVVPPSLAATIAETVDAPGPFAAYRIGQEVQAFGTTFRPAGAPVRLVRRAGARLRLGRGLAAELRATDRRAGRLRHRLLVRGAASFAAAVEEIDADATTLAALLAGRRVQPRLWHLILPPLVAGGRAFAAAGPWRGTRAVRHRWTLTVLDGYRAVVAYAKLWEIRQAEVSTPR